MKYSFEKEDKYEKLKSDWRVRQQLFLPLKPAPNKLFFQYRSFEGFWSIISSDSIWARNIRFSNDNTERKQGIDILSEISLEKNNKRINDENDYFMICFCEENDRLSQWRGYASKGGASIGFDFRSLMPYRIMKRKSTPDGKTDYVDIVVRPCPVEYTTQEKKSELLSRFETHNVFDNRENEESIDSTMNLLSFVPYIKDSGFKEEIEWRIIISEYFNSLDKNLLRQCIHFEKSNNLQIPYIVVKAGANEYDEKECVVRIQIDDVELKEKIKSQLEEKLKFEKTDIILCDTYSQRTACYGCSQKIIINNESVKDYDDDSYVFCCGESGEECVYPRFENQIIISQGKNQKTIFEKIDSVIHKVQNSSSNIKIWCEGHLPIRQITVSPCENQDEVVESIKNYCQNSENYWLRYVDVDCSKIPYRAPIEK